MTNTPYDLIIIGAGPAGFSAALAAKESSTRRAPWLGGEPARLVICVCHLDDFGPPTMQLRNGRRPWHIEGHCDNLDSGKRLHDAFQMDR